MKKHKEILEELERKNLIERIEQSQGKKTITNYKITPRGLEFCKMILEPYEDMFPRVEPADDGKKEVDG